MPGIPAWNEIPQNFWRPNNPPLDIGPLPVPIPTLTFPTYEEIGGDSFFAANIGVPLEADMTLASQTLNAGSSVWFSRTIYDVLALWAKGKPTADQVSEVVLKHRNEWRKILGLIP